MSEDLINIIGGVILIGGVCYGVWLLWPRRKDEPRYARKAFGICAPPDGAAHDQWMDFASLMAVSGWRTWIDPEVRERIVAAYRAKWDEPPRES